MRRKIAAALLAAATVITMAGCSDDTPNPSGTDTAKGQDITFWLIGGDTPQSARDYLIEEYNKRTGGTLTIVEQTWGDIITKLTTNMPDANNTPDVTEIGNTQSPSFTNVGAFLDISDMYQELGGTKLLQSFVDVGMVDGKNYTLPYYFGSRYMFYRKDVWEAAGYTEMPTTLDAFNAAVIDITTKNPLGIADFSGMFLGGQDWRDGVSWVFANGGELAKYENGQWAMTLSDPNTIKGLQQLQDIQLRASMAPTTARDQSPWLYINDSDSMTNDDGTTSATALSAATIMAPGWAHWSIGDLEGDARVWNPDKFGTYVLPGNDGKPAPVFAGGSNVGISAASKNVEGAKELMRIIFSAEYQQILGQNGLGPANSDYVNSLGNDEFAKALIESASNSKLTPAAVGWAGVEATGKLEEFFARVAEGGDVVALAAEYDATLTPLLNQA
ncbi:MAG: extracellular solute-binding protein [Propionibacteriaceae bacterium]|jgi:N,N'-diacetylchitobiose transport system substrate-binding protein|nr:extracellular solute-binding protein [Propionibacteriaceae bacterium]